MPTITVECLEQLLNRFVSDIKKDLSSEIAPPEAQERAGFFVNRDLRIVHMDGLESVCPEAVDVAERFASGGWAIVRRTPSVQVRVESRDGQEVIAGLVAPYDSPSNPLGTQGIREVYSPGCFGESLQGDIRILAHHDETRLLGRTGNGTARVFERDDGVHFEVVMPENISYARDILESVRRGDIAGSSSGFYVPKDGFTIEKRGEDFVRIIRKARLSEASIVSMPAYPAATSQIVKNSVQPIGPADLETFDLADYHLKLKQIELAGL